MSKMIGVVFSGTGNTKHCVERFLNGIEGGSEIYPIENPQAVAAVKGADEIVFAYPVYYSNLPKIVRDFITDNAELWRGKRIFIIATMGLFSGDGAGCAARLFKKYGAYVAGGLHLKMPDCIGDVKLLKKPPEKNRELIKRADEKTGKAVAKINAENIQRTVWEFLRILRGCSGNGCISAAKPKNTLRELNRTAKNALVAGYVRGYALCKT